MCRSRAQGTQKKDPEILCENKMEEMRMKITELLKPESIALGVKASSKDEIIDCLTGLMD